MTSTTTGTRHAARHRLGGDQRVLDQFGIADPDRLAAQPLGDLDVIDAVAFQLRRVDVLERQLHAIVHLEAALRLPDQAEIGVVHDDVDVGQIELRADRQLLDQELEVVVAGDRDDLAVGIGDAHAERGRDRPAERPRLAALIQLRGL